MTAFSPNPAELSRLIAMAVAAGPDAQGTVALMRSVARNEIACLFASNQLSVSEFKRFVRASADGPTIVVLGDDAGKSVGPSGFPCAQRAVEWARAVLLHGA